MLMNIFLGLYVKDSVVTFHLQSFISVGFVVSYISIALI